MERVGLWRTPAPPPNANPPAPRALDVADADHEAGLGGVVVARVALAELALEPRLVERVGIGLLVLDDVLVERLPRLRGVVLAPFRPNVSARRRNSTLAPQAQRRWKGLRLSRK